MKSLLKQGYKPMKRRTPLRNGVNAVSFPALADRFSADWERNGATVIVAGQLIDKAARIGVVSTEATTECLLFLWNITPGGGGAHVRRPETA
jgi:hypothetical protein